MPPLLASVNMPEPSWTLTILWFGPPVLLAALVLYGLVSTVWIWHRERQGR